MKKQISTLKFLAALALSSGLMFSCSKTELNQESNLSLKSAKVGAQLSAVNLSQSNLIWSDEFNSVGTFDTSKWSYADRGTVAWNRYMTHTTDYVSTDGNNLLLRMDNAVIAGDNVPYHAGGVKSIGKFSMRYGKVEVRAKFTQGRGSWPAIWMMPEPATQYAGWPGGGEIDIMEHVNNENVVYHTIHNASVTNANGGSTASKAASFLVNDFNTYTMEWTPNAIRFYVNSILQYTYSKSANGGWQQWPFDVPFYLILNQAGGAGWPGPITNADLPFSMQVDYVRVYTIPLFGNGGFETGSLSPWSSWGGGASIVNSNMQSGTKCIQLTGTNQTAVEQVVSGLKPNTTYRISGAAKVATSGSSVTLGVKNHGNATTAVNFSDNLYTTKSVIFTTGASSTSATIYFYKFVEGTVFGDDFILEEI